MDDTTQKTGSADVLTDLRKARNELATLIARCSNRTRSREDQIAIEDIRIEIDRLENEYEAAQRLLYQFALRNQ